jgi:hypothetical protein
VARAHHQRTAAATQPQVHTSTLPRPQLLPHLLLLLLLLLPELLLLLLLGREVVVECCWCCCYGGKGGKTVGLEN